jgi:hypothetical protein
MIEKTKKDVAWITRSGLLLACLIVVQLIPFPAPFKQLITGPLVNMVLLIAAMSIGLLGGIVLAILSPVLAQILQTHSILGPLFFVIPFIMLGNMVYVLFFHWFRGKKDNIVLVSIGLILGSVLKFFVLYLAVTIIIKNLPLPLKTAMGITQLYTALGGGVLAITIGHLLGLLKPKK